MISPISHSACLQTSPPPPSEEKKQEDPIASPEGLFRTLSTTQQVVIAQIIGHPPEHPLTTEIFRVTMESLQGIEKEAASNGLKFPILSFSNSLDPANPAVTKVKLIISPPDRKTKSERPYLLVSTRNKGTFKKHFDSLDLERISRCAFLIMKEGTADEPTRYSMECVSAIQNLKRFSSQGVAALLHDFVYPSLKPEIRKFALVLERCDRDLSSEPQPISNERFLQIFTKSAEALLAFHSRGVIHRDIKPQNLGVQEGPEGLEIKLLDLDFACFRGSPFRFCGSPLYVAPEIIKTAYLIKRHPLIPLPPASPAQDVWSLGCSMASMAANTHLFFQPAEVAKRIEFPILSGVSWDSLVTESIERQIPILSFPEKQLLIRMLQEDPRKRPTMLEVVESLKQLQSKDAELATER